MCEACWSGLELTRPLDVRFDASHAIRWAAAVAAYDGRMKDVIHALKYDRRRSISPRLGALMRASGAELLRDAECVAPVPLHPRRAYRRGFNQAHDLALHLGPPVLPLLRRVIATRSQIDLPRHARHLNVRDAFAVNDKPKGLSPHGLFDQPEGLSSIGIAVLVDDVATTGATLEACARVLTAAGVKEVRALTAARVVTEPR